MTIDATVAKMESLCDRLENALAQLRTAPAQEKRGNPYAALREKYPNAGKAWSAQEDEELRRLFEGGNAVADVAPTLGRTPNGVRLRLERLNLLGPQRSSLPPGS